MVNCLTRDSPLPRRRGRRGEVKVWILPPVAASGRGRSASASSSPTSALAAEPLPPSPSSPLAVSVVGLHAGVGGVGGGGHLAGDRGAARLSPPPPPPLFMLFSLGLGCDLPFLAPYSSPFLSCFLLSLCLSLLGICPSAARERRIRAFLHPRGGMVGGRRNYSDLDTRRIRLRRPTAAAAQGPMGGRQGSCSERNASPPPPPPSLPLSLCVSGLLSPPLGLGRYNKGEINPLSDPSAVPPPFLWLRQRPPPTDEDDRPDSHSVVALRRLSSRFLFPFFVPERRGGGDRGSVLFPCQDG